MKISTKGRYALRMMLDLAEHQGDGYVALKDIAQRQGISKKYLEQILQRDAIEIIADDPLQSLPHGQGGACAAARARVRVLIKTGDRGEAAFRQPPTPMRSPNGSLGIS